MKLTLILGNQLFSDWTGASKLKLGPQDEVIMIEDLGIAKAYRYHRLRLLHTFVAMREFRDHLLSKNIKVHYFEMAESKNLRFEDRIMKVLGSRKEFRVADVVDRHFKKNLNRYFDAKKVKIEYLPTPQFLGGEQNFSDYLKKRLANGYKFNIWVKQRIIRHL